MSSCFVWNINVVTPLTLISQLGEASDSLIDSRLSFVYYGFRAKVCKSDCGLHIVEAQYLYI